MSIPHSTAPQLLNKGSLVAKAFYDSKSLVKLFENTEESINLSMPFKKRILEYLNYTTCGSRMSDFEFEELGF